MTRGAGRAAALGALISVVVAVIVPPLLIANGFRALAREQFVELEYGRTGFPPDRYGLDDAERRRLAIVGLRSIQPGTEGVELLRQATLPDGTPAFNQREVAHMADVRGLFVPLMWFQLAAVAAVVGLGLGLARTGARRAVPRGLLAGSAATLIVAAVAAPIVLLGFDGFFLRFHTLFFEGDSWRFAESDTLLRLYPEVFWQHTAQLMAGMVLVQAVAVGGASWWWLRRLARGAGPGEA